MKYIAAVFLYCLALGALAVDLEYHKEGAICDRASGFCADHMGVSAELTRLYLGEKAGQKLLAEINKVGINEVDLTIFTMHGGLNCDTKVKTCWTNRFDKKIDTKATNTLFKNPSQM